MTRELATVFLLAWALAAVGLSASGAEGVGPLLVVAPFTLFGVGMAVALALPGERPTAQTLVLVLGLGLGTATVIAQALLLVGLFHPALVVGVVAIVAAAALAVREVSR
ncbi:hypothetical protein FBY40_1196 [Microbacterium sp. SLBN-154]|uniref:hypothetical protein n=1 Tax=Microbacterium sp. SLBN-154 TaxID=2768458 RepID=UPI00114E77AC|nr:hypothetical protein [Microbacterium sp. SLBN-154]TQK18707.1 hypothetical protein FBY40_1196 [Microbacterium sp. SLBN-154]